MNQFAGKLELEAGITVLQNECERIFSSVPIHFGKGVSLTHGASIYCTGVGDDIYIGDNNIIGGELILFPGARIGNRCVFGTGTIIVAGSFSVGNGCVMSHGCTITQDVPAFFSGSFWVHPAITRLAMIAINTNFFIMILI
ncbi:transferase [Parabacteroides goldsteinii]|uniref:transferase n=1 Tax=Parabacteroides goldsteinii TaxID=328812 RepID=UPI0025A31D7F|nr:transferase [Parabacteroides goldsteinii]